MITENFDIITSTENKLKIHKYQKLYSTAFRILYNNMDLMDDKNFQANIIKKYVFTLANYRYLKEHVETKFKQQETIKQNKLNELNKLQKYLLELTNEKPRNIKKIKKLQSKISRKLKSVDAKVTFGGKELLRTITNQSRYIKSITEEHEKYKEKLEILNKNKQLFKDERIMMMNFTGESSYKGNRYFNMKHLSEGKVIFVYNKEKIEFTFKISTKRQHKLLDKLQSMINNKEIPLTIGFSKDKFHISYEEGKLNGKYFDKKKFFKGIKHITDKEERKKIVSNAYKQHEKKCFKDKIANRYFGLDLNPNGIGYCIGDRLSEDINGHFKLIKHDYVCFEELNVKGVSSDKKEE